MAEAADVRPWETLAHGIYSIVAASTRNRARFLTWQAAREAGYRTKFGEIRVRRAVEHDVWAVSGREGRIMAAPEVAEVSDGDA